MENLKCNDNMKGFKLLAKTANKYDTNLGIKILGSYFDPEFSNPETVLEKITYVTKIGMLPLALVSGLTIHGLDILVKKAMLSITLNVPTHKVAFNVGSFFDRSGAPKEGIVACAETLSCKDIRNVNTDNLQYALKDIHAESWTEEELSKFSALKVVGGNLHLSSSVDISKVDALLPNLEHIGGKILVNGQERVKSRTI